MDSGYKIGDIMTREVHTTFQGEIISLCARKMRDEMVGSLVVIEGNKVVGILTEQDLARKVVAEAKDAHATLVKEIMSKKVVYINPDEDINKAVELMGQNSIKHLPVISNGKLEGIITFKDIIAIEPALIEILSFKNNLEYLKNKQD